MKKNIKILIIIGIITMLILGACAKNNSNNSKKSNSNSTTKNVTYTKSDLFTDRDLEQNVSLDEAIKYNVSNNENITINKEGIYVISGTSKNTTIYVEIGDEENVQIVLDGVSITNDNYPCIYVKSGDKVLITTTNTKNTLSVTGSFKTDDSTNLDGVIFSKSDLVLNGVGTLIINSTNNGIVSKDDLKVTGGTYNITAASKCFEANDSIRISGGTFTLKAGTDALHAEYDDDDSVGYIYICGGKINITAGDDAIHATTIVQIDDGTIEISASEGIEATQIQINGGNININASDDGINAAYKSKSIGTPLIEFNGGTVIVKMGQGDTDGIDSNGNIIVNGGTINVTAASTFDYDGTGTYNGGTIIANGNEIDYIPNQMMGGHGGGRGNRENRGYNR